MRVIDCECGETLHAASDGELVDVYREHVAEAHDEDAQMDDDELRETIAEHAYEATDS